MPTLITPRLILRDYRMDDLDAHHALMSDRAVMAFLPDLYCATPEETRRNLEAAVREAALPADTRRLWFFCMETHDGQPVGSIGYTVTARTPGGMQLAQGNKLCEAGYFIRSHFWGQGYTTEAFRETVRFAFEQGGVHRLTAGCNTENGASRAVMVKCGMVHEATRPQHTWYDGRWCDRLEYRLLREEWARCSGSGGSPGANTPMSSGERRSAARQGARRRRSRRSDTGARLARPLPVQIIPYMPTYRDDMLYCYLSAKAALGRAPRLREDLLDIPASYGDGFWLALDEGGRVAGMVGIHMATAGEAWLKRLFIRPDCKRRGVGTALLREAEAYARALGAVHLHTRFSEDFSEAPRFYAARGFKPAVASAGLHHRVKGFTEDI